MTSGREWDELADEHGVAAVAEGQPTRWYDELWSAAGRGEVSMPWDRTEPYDLLAAHVAGQDGAGRRAVVVGAGYGADAEHLARQGWETTAFDISPAAVAAAQQRYPDSQVDYRVADLLDLPADLVGSFHLVVEIFTIQALHGSLRAQAVAGVRRLVAPGGTLFVVQIVREDAEEVAAEPPWLLDRAEMAALEGDGLVIESLDRLPHADPERRDRWRMVLTRR
jgi:SAM-dependent methyltransferase